MLPAAPIRIHIDDCNSCDILSLLVVLHISLGAVDSSNSRTWTYTQQQQQQQKGTSLVTPEEPSATNAMQARVIRVMATTDTSA